MDTPAVVKQQQQQQEEEFELSLAGASDYLRYKIPTLTIAGGLYGAGAGYFIGGLTALYGYGYGFGSGVIGTAFYSTTYGLKCARKKDDYINYGISGGFNAAWITSGLYGYKRGIIACVGGLVAGITYKIIGDRFYSLSRDAWLEHRHHELYKSYPRILTIRKPKFPPKADDFKNESVQRQSASIIPKEFIGPKDS
jgi:hypothetical protein